MRLHRGFELIERPRHEYVSSPIAPQIVKKLFLGFFSNCIVVKSYKFLQIFFSTVKHIDRPSSLLSKHQQIHRLKLHPISVLICTRLYHREKNGD